MRDDDFDCFCQLLDDVHELRRIAPASARAKALFFQTVAAYPLQVIEGAIRSHLRDPEAGRYTTPLQPAHLIAQIEGAQADDGRPGPDEAWAMALHADDERNTVVWTPEMAQAFAVARPLLAKRDNTGARMAFRQAYDRAVTDARRKAVPVAWSPSLGSDPQQRAVAIEHAVVAGLLPHSQAQLLLPAPIGDTGPTAAGIATLAKIRGMLANALSAGDKASLRRSAANDRERQRLDAAKAATDLRVHEFQAAQQ